MNVNTGINTESRKKIAQDLAVLLADSYTLYLKTHNYQWNVTGTMFQTLHTMFETQYTELATAVDVIAERIRALGEKAPGSYTEFSRLASIKDEEGHPGAREMIKKLVEGHEAVVKNIRSMFPRAQEAQDEATVEILTQRIQLHEKTAWMLRSLLED